MKKTLIGISIGLNIILITNLFYILGHKTDLSQRFYAKVIHQVYVPIRHDADCVNSWNACVRQLNLHVDIAFFGNSITEGGNWQEAFPDLRVINLGYIGEDSKGMLRRVEQIKSVHPEKVFIMAGINGLKNQTQEQFEYHYTNLIDSIRSAVPYANIYLESLLPVSRWSTFCPNEKIVNANEFIRQYAANHNCTFVDVYAVYVADGALPDELTSDGLHLVPEAYQPWYNLVRKDLR